MQNVETGGNWWKLVQTLKILMRALIMCLPFGRNQRNRVIMTSVSYF